MPRSGEGAGWRVGQNIEVGKLEGEWRLALGFCLGGLLCWTQKSRGVKEGRESRREDQRPADSRKEEALRARGLRPGGLTPLPAVAQHSLPPSPQGFGVFVVLGTDQQ